MTIIRNYFIKSLFFLAIAISFVNCKKDDDSALKGSAKFEITDAPIDNTNIKGAFVTITAVKVDGENISSFTGKQTIDLMAYQNGNTKALGLAELEAGSYSNVSLLLDYTSDANGNSPGCYVLTADDTKHSLQSNTNNTSEIIINSSTFTVKENSTTQIVLDFDVRKAIKNQEAAQSNDQYDFVTMAELRSSVRLVNKEKTAQIKGKLSDTFNASGDRVVVYAYKKGTFNQQTETQGQGDGQIMFKNAVTSSVVAEDGSYHLSFLTEGEYELHYVSYEKEGNDGSLKAKAMLSVSSQLSLDVLGLQLNASTDLNVDVSVLAASPI